VIAAATRTLQMSFVLGVGLSLAVGVGLYFGAGIFSKSVLVVHLIRIGLPVQIFFCITFTTNNYFDKNETYVRKFVTLVTHTQFNQIETTTKNLMRLFCVIFI